VDDSFFSPIQDAYRNEGQKRYRYLEIIVTYDYLVTMPDVRIAELKARLSEYLRAVRRGHEVTVYDRNEPIARVVPYARGSSLVVREPVRKYGTLGEIPLPPPIKLRVDPVELLLEDRRSE